MIATINEAEAEKWINGLAAFDSQNQNVALAMFSVFGIPKTYLDIGSGTGAMVNTARKLDVDAWGVDLLPRPHWAHLLRRDLREPLYLNRTFDIVSSFETAEHLPSEYADTFVDSIARHVRLDGLVVFTAAMPGQIGDGHLNLQQALYWREKFDARGCYYHPELTHKLALAWSVAHHALHHLEANLQVFLRYQSNR